MDKLEREADNLARSYGEEKREAFLQVLRRQEGDLYTGVAAVALGVVESEVTAEVRSAFKAVLFTYVYG
jgi:DNA polymerase I-like protein with 3'-5' exonuclease and polymerase domains